MLELPPPPSDPTEAAHHAAMRALLEAPGDPFSRAHFAPGHFTASAFVLSPDERALLLIWHTKLGRWLQPGGHVEAADVDLEAAARREVEEETGVVDLTRLVAGPFDLDVHAIPAHGEEPAHRHFDVRYLFRAPSLDLAHGSEVGGARWVALAGIGPDDTDDSVLRAVRKLSAWAERLAEGSGV